MQPLLCLELAADAHTPSVARRRAQEYVASHVPEEVVQEVGLLVTELVTNAVRHAGTRLRLGVAFAERSLRIEVFDHSDELPAMQDPQLEDVSGRGLRLVDAIATQWGAVPLSNGKVVWCELEHRTPFAPG
jgi:two-component sensor histidine kinase